MASIEKPLVSDNWVVLVISKGHPKFGQLGRYLHCERAAEGVCSVEFSDGSREELYEGIRGITDMIPQVKSYYRRSDVLSSFCDDRGYGPQSLKKDFLALRVGGEDVFAARYKELFG